MNIEPTNILEYLSKPNPPSFAADSGFTSAVEAALNLRDTYTVISPKLEEKLSQDPDLAQNVAKKLAELTRGYSGDGKNRLIVVDRRGEVAEYNTSRDKRAEQREYENAKEAAKARLRKKARLEAYFKIVKQISIKRKLIELENLKHPRNKRYRKNGTQLDNIAQNILQQPNRVYPFYF